MVTLANVINKVLSLVIIGLFINCADNSSQKIFNDTFEKVLSSSVRDFRYNRPPTFEEFKDNIEPQHFSKRPDTLKKLKISVSLIPLEFDFIDYIDKIPSDYMFLFDSEKNLHPYIPLNIENYLNDNYELKFLNRPEQIKIKKFQGLDYGGLLQVSNILTNLKKDRAIILVRITRSKLDSSSKLILFKKNNGKWIISDQIGISLS